MRLGDKVHNAPTYDTAYGTAFGLKQAEKSLHGRVVYIHPTGRFYTVEFTADTGETYRESYYFADQSGQKG